MTIMHPKHKGALAELQACAWLLKQGYEVFRNISQCGFADLIAWKPGGDRILIEVRRLAYHVSVDGKSCSIVRATRTRHPDVRFLFACAESGDCSFDPAVLVEALGYTIRPTVQRRLVCSVAGCGRKHDAKGYCAMHYDRIFQVWQRRKSGLAVSSEA